MCIRFENAQVVLQLEGQDEVSQVSRRRHGEKSALFVLLALFEQQYRPQRRTPQGVWYDAGLRHFSLSCELRYVLVTTGLTA